MLSLSIAGMALTATIALVAYVVRIMADEPVHRSVLVTATVAGLLAFGLLLSHGYELAAVVEMVTVLMTQLVCVGVYVATGRFVNWGSTPRRVTSPRVNDRLRVIDGGRQ